MNLRLFRWHLKRSALSPAQLLNFLGILRGIVLFHLSKVYHPPRKPFILMIEPTNLCNFNCPLCDRGSGKITRSEGMMNLDDFRKILDMTASGLKLLMLWNQGEPLINKQFPDMVREAKKRNIFTIASTNGSLLERYAEELIDCGLDELIVSLDGATEATYNRYRRGGDFNSITAGARKLVESRGKRLHPLVSLQFLLLKHNISEIEDFRRLAKEIGADRILWKTVQVGNQQDAEEFLPENSRFSRYAHNRFGQLIRMRKGCRRILYSAVIDWNGNTVPCCFDKDEEFLLGNILEEGLDKVWRGKKFAEFRARIAKGDMPEMCNNCTEGLERLFL